MRGAAFLVAALLAHGGVVWAEPTVRFEPLAVVVSGLDPGATVLLLGAGRDHTGIRPEVLTPAEVATDGDGDGTIELSLGRRVPMRSVWLIVDLATGSFSSAAPEGSAAREVDAQTGEAASMQTLAGDVYRYPTGLLRLCVVRPCGGVWAATVGDGSIADADGASDGYVTVAVAAMAALSGGVAAPARLEPDDLVVAIDLDLLQYSLARVGAAPGGDQ